MAPMAPMASHWSQASSILDPGSQILDPKLDFVAGLVMVSVLSVVGVLSKFIYGVVMLVSFS